MLCACVHAVLCGACLCLQLRVSLSLRWRHCECSYAVSTTGEQRELVRRTLLCILDAGYSPMKFFAKDYKKYFYLAELCSLIDLSAVRPLHSCSPTNLVKHLWKLGVLAARCLTADVSSYLICGSICGNVDGEDGGPVQPLGRQRRQPWH